MYEISAETVIRGDLAVVWATATDVEGRPVWDPHEQTARLDGAFAPGTTGWSKPRGGPGVNWLITTVEPLCRWGSQSRVPGGKLVGENRFEDLGQGQIRCHKTVRVIGPFAVLFRLYFGKRIRRDFFKTWSALELEAARRADLVA
ncbi:SRPBCC family protein [Nocardia sp. NBC_01327]|uniref:SRPBCC family protein n=1 Tax=Nocardia sp. NBC_01327 TaxID=2903593 RepID=UPI002E14C796|nr:SRPBCC family protein [Nocardia sp. NBC_01327]